MKTAPILLTFLLAVSVASAQDDNEPVPPWNVTVGSRYMSRYTNYGVDLSQNKSALGYDLAFTHEEGFTASCAAIQTLGSGGDIQQWSLGAGYTWQISESFSLTGEYTHYVYANDSVNILASLTNGLSFSADLSLDDVDIGVSYDTFLGTNTASYFGLDISGFYQAGDMSIVPLAQVTFMSQSVQTRLLKSGKGGPGTKGPPSSTSGTSTSTTTVTGLSNFSLHLVLIYPIVEHLSLSLHPAYQYSPRPEVATSTSLFVWSVGLRYSYDF